MLERIRKAKDEGFTLIELLIVIVILGILAAIVVFAIGSTRKDSVASACKTDFKSVELSAEAAKTKTGSYPASSDDLLESANKGGLLKAYPTNDDYNLSYSSGTITVQKPASSSFTSVGGTNATNKDGCDDL